MGLASCSLFLKQDSDITVAGIDLMGDGTVNKDSFGSAALK